MAQQRYICPQHGEFTITQSIHDRVRKLRACPFITAGRYSPDALTTPTICGLASPWVPSAPAAVHVEGGSGAGRQAHQRRNDARTRFREEQNLE